MEKKINFLSIPLSQCNPILLLYRDGKSDHRLPMSYFSLSIIKSVYIKNQATRGKEQYQTGNLLKARSRGTLNIYDCIVSHFFPKEFEEMYIVESTKILDNYTYRVARLWPVFGSQNLIGCWLSLLPETTNPFVGCQSTHLTSAP